MNFFRNSNNLTGNPGSGPVGSPLHNSSFESNRSFSFIGRSSSARALAEPGNSRDKALKIKNYPFKKSERIGDDEKGDDYYKIVQDKDKKN